jgi:hypothetical protein
MLSLMGCGSSYGHAALVMTSIVFTGKLPEQDARLTASIKASDRKQPCAVRILESFTA